MGLSFWRAVLCGAILQVATQDACEVYSAIDALQTQAQADHCVWSEVSEGGRGGVRGEGEEVGSER
jgi:hypothetical protein